MKNSVVAPFGGAANYVSFGAFYGTNFSTAGGLNDISVAVKKCRRTHRRKTWSARCWKSGRFRWDCIRCKCSAGNPDNISSPQTTFDNDSEHQLLTCTRIQLEGCIVSNKHNTVLARSGLLYVISLFLGAPECWTQTVSRSLPNFLQGSLGDRPTDRPTDHATRSFTIGGIYLRSTAMYSLIIIIAAYLGCYTCFHVCIVVRNKAVVDSRLRFAGGVESHA